MSISQFSKIDESDHDRYWFALYTRPKFESKVDEELSELDIQSYLPLRSVVKQWSDRRKIVKEPLFPSYVFAFADRRERAFIFQPRGVVRIVSFNGRPARIPEQQINAVRRILDSGHSPEVCARLTTGDEVEVASGPLTGLRGFVRESRGNNYFIVSIEGIGQSISVSINVHDLKPIAKHHQFANIEN